MTNSIPEKEKKPIASDISDRSGSWLLFFEKGYMYLHGSYNWAGSYAELDVYILTGWIPQVRKFLSSTIDGKQVDENESQRNKSFEILRNAYENDCIITFSNSENHSFYLEFLTVDTKNLTLIDPLTHEKVQIIWNDLWSQIGSKNKPFFDRFGFNLDPYKYSFRIMKETKLRMCSDHDNTIGNELYVIVTLDKGRKIDSSV